MANTLTLTIAANFSGNGAQTSNTVNGYVSTIASNSAPQGINSDSVPTTSGGVAIPLGGIAAPRYLFVQNLDATNYVSILTAVSGTEIARLLPGATGGDAIMIPLAPGITAPAWVAHTSACNVNYRVFPT